MPGKRHKPPVEIVDAVHVIRDFVSRYGVEYSRFQKLKADNPAFSGLNERRLREWVTNPDGLRRNPQRRTVARLTALAKWIAEDEIAVLNALRVSSPGLVFARTSSSIRPRSFACDDPNLSVAQINALAIRQAANGFHDSAVRFLTDAFRRYVSRNPQAAISVVPTMFYVLYRYCATPVGCDNSNLGKTPDIHED